MYCSNCGAEVEGKFCSNCGAKIIVNVQQTPPSANPDTASAKVPPKAAKAVPSILARSESCIPILEKKRNRIFIIRWVLWGIDAVLGFIVFPILFFYWESHLSRVSLSAMLPYVSIVMLALIVSSIIGIVLFLRQVKEINNFYMRYRFYASTEHLIVEDRKITGSTTKGSLKLTYDQIRNVTFSLSDPSSRAAKMLDFSNTILKIRDAAGKEFVFYSFSNCEELKTVIDWRCAGEQED